MTNITALAATIAAAEVAGRAAYAAQCAAALAAAEEAFAASETAHEQVRYDAGVALAAAKNPQPLRRFGGINIEGGRLMALFEIWGKYGEVLTIAVPINEAEPT